ncbi:MAG: Fic family protein [Syntrophothermus sp.]
MKSWDINFDPRIDLNDRALWGLYVQVESYRLSVLKIPIPPGVRREIDRLNIVRQIKGTTGIEGNTLSEAEIREITGLSVSAEPADAEARKKRKERSLSLEEQEVVNAKKVLDFIHAWTKTHPDDLITEDLIRHLHVLTTESCNYPHNIPGRYRSHAVTAGEYRAPDPNDVPRLMQTFLQFINSREAREGYRPLIRAILAHFYLISIHPFGDGNGRTSRALEAYILYSGGYNVREFYSLANFYYRNRQRYIEELQKARFEEDGRLQDFVKFSLEGFVDELQKVQDQILSFVCQVIFRDYVNALFAGDEINWRMRGLLEYLTLEKAEIPLEEFKLKRHYIADMIYKGYKGTKTLLRDLAALQQNHLITISNGRIAANIGLVDNLAENST